MKYKWYLLPLMIVFMSCGGVSPEISLSKLGEVNIGDSYSKYKGDDNSFRTEVILDTLLPKTDAGDEYRVLFYEYYFGEKPSLFNYFDFSGSDNYTYAAITFKNNKVIFFGFPEDYNRSYIQEVNYIGKKMPGLLRYLEDENWKI